MPCLYIETNTISPDNCEKKNTRTDSCKRKKTRILLDIIKLLIINWGKVIDYRFLKTRGSNPFAKSQRISAWDSFAAASPAGGGSKTLRLYLSRRWGGERRAGFIKWQPISFVPHSGRYTRNFLRDYPPLCFIPEDFADCYPIFGTFSFKGRFKERASATRPRWMLQRNVRTRTFFEPPRTKFACCRNCYKNSDLQRAEFNARALHLKRAQVSNDSVLVS